MVMACDGPSNKEVQEGLSIPTELVKQNISVECFELPKLRKPNKTRNKPPLRGMPIYYARLSAGVSGLLCVQSGQCHWQRILGHFGHS